ncbi:4-coumarate--CoA ligase family protein [Solihabitans fulvus]|uniref:4-coumarate--CoA ligase family protein n=1 Tax=Solihabitans fulvus TaxID=1892852 RepID=A0A5B2XM61_9PSEU|nr:4-coumarate--CoA ligase family protein [Solihabitans fulvus]
MVFRSPYPDVEIPDVSLPDFLFADLGDRADRPALVDGVSGAALTYAELAAAVDRVAAALAERGIRKGDVVGILCPNSPRFAVVYHGVLRAGAVATTINGLYTAHEIAAQLADSGAKLLFTVAALLGTAEPAAAEAGIADVVLLFADDTAPGRPTVDDLLASTAPVPDVRIDPAVDLAVLPYSSGTTGRAKGVMLTHRNLVANLCQTTPALELFRAVRVLAVLPFFHIYGMNSVLNHGLHTGSTVVTMPRFDLAAFLGVIARHRTERVYIAPPVAVMLAKHPMVDDYDLSALQLLFCGAATLDEELAGAVAERLGCIVHQGYGMTELSPVSHVIPDLRPDVPLGTCGVPIPNLECRLIDPATGEDLGVGERGELLCRGPNVMTGYLNNPEATAATLDEDGYLHTGDVAVFDERGFITIVDRVKELIKYKGYQVPPAELEALLLTHPGIADAAVVGVADSEGEEVPKAFVVRQEGEPGLDGRQVMDFVAERVAPHKKVRLVEFLDAIPKSASGKILRRELRAR